MSLLDQHNRSVGLPEANEIAMRESEGRLSFVEDGSDVMAIYRCLDSTHDGEQLPQQRIRMSRLALTTWGVFEMARAAGPRPERMVHARADRRYAIQPV